MELCLIAPVAHVKYTSLLPGRFCLGQVATEYPPYKDYFKRASVAGYEVALDNGAFEGELLGADEYIKVAQEINPTVIIVPDLLNGNAEANYEFAREFVRNSSYAQKKELMFVPQCKEGDTEGYHHTLSLAIESGLFKWIGICRNSVNNAFFQFTKTEDESLNKFYFGVWAERLGVMEEARKQGIKFHLLGIGNILALLQYMWWVSRADTAGLFFQATLGNTVSDFGYLEGRVRRPSDYFRRTFSSSWEEALRDNCKAALTYATTAGRKRDRIISGRI